MNQRIGTYITQKVAGETYKAYVPPKLPPNPPLDLTKLYRSTEPIQTYPCSNWCLFPDSTILVTERG